VDFYNNIFSCNYERLPPEVMAHSFLGQSTAMDGYVKCRRKVTRTKHLDIITCKRHISHICSRKMVETSLNSNCHIVIRALNTITKSNPSVRNERSLLKLVQKHLHENGFNIPIGDENNLLQFVKHGRCIEIMRSDNFKCLHLAKKKCQTDNLLVVQVNRMKMEDLEPVIKTNPDMRVIHYTRDPRAIAFSRSRTGILIFDKINRSSVREAEFVCHKMREDLKQRLILEKKYPHVFTHLTYESFATDPERFARRIYGMLNKTYPEEWKPFVAKHMYGKSEGSMFGITVKNATRTAFRWRSKIPKYQLDMINGFCGDVITGLGYQL